MNLDPKAFLRTLNECQFHLQTMLEAREDMANLMPLDAQKLARISKENRRIIDQFLFRFSKLQDTMGIRLFKSALALLGEETDRLSFIDLLNRLEKLDLIADAEEWLALRDMRNALSHEYEEEREALAESINLIYRRSSSLIDHLAPFTQLAERRRNA